MKALILTEGGGNIGFGHLSRCSALSQAIKEQNGHAEVEFIIKWDGSTGNFFSDRTADDMLFFDWIKDEDRTLDAVKKADAVVIDSYLAEKPLYDIISDMAGGRVLMIDDNDRVEYPGGVVVNPSIYGEKVVYKKKDKIVYLLGKDYVILRKEFIKIPGKIISKRVKDVLITLGGKNYPAFIKKALGFLIPSYGFNLHVVSFGKNLELRYKEEKSSRISFYSDLSAVEIRRLMLKYDFCISGGGQTLYELARCGMPTIGICFAENQRKNLEEFHKAGFVDYIGWYGESKILHKLGNAVECLLSQEIRREKSAKGKSLVDGKGVKRILKTVGVYG